MNGKLQVIGAILRIDRPFRPPNVVEMTGLDRQLVRYHLNNFVTEGVLDRHDKYYSLVDKERLILLMTEISDKVDVSKMNPTMLYNRERTDYLNRVAEYIVCLRVLDPELGGNSRELLAKGIDDTEKELKRLRKFLMNSERSEASAAKKLKGQAVMDTYEDIKTLMSTWTTKYDKREWIEAVKEALEDD